VWLKRREAHDRFRSAPVAADCWYPRAARHTPEAGTLVALTVISGIHSIVNEVFAASATCSCFTPGKSQPKYDTKLIADQVIKKTIKAIKK
jgi:hypothetical protein